MRGGRAGRCPQSGASSVQTGLAGGRSSAPECIDGSPDRDNVPVGQARRAEWDAVPIGSGEGPDSPTGRAPVGGFPGAGPPRTGITRQRAPDGGIRASASGWVGRRRPNATGGGAWALGLVNPVGEVRRKSARTHARSVWRRRIVVMGRPQQPGTSPAIPRSTSTPPAKPSCSVTSSSNAARPDELRVDEVDRGLG